MLERVAWGKRRSTDGNIAPARLGLIEDPVGRFAIRPAFATPPLAVDAQSPDYFLDSSETGRSVVRRLVPLYLLLLQSEAFR